MTNTPPSALSGLDLAAGRSFFMLTYLNEHQQVDKRFREQHPELSTEERNQQVTETAAVRTGSQVLASAAAGAAVGSAVPVAGTAIGLAVGIVVGLAMCIPTSHEKTLGDNIADFGEFVWNWGKGVLGG